MLIRPLRDLAPRTLNVVFDLAYRFVAYISQPETVERFGLHGAQLHLCFNHDRDTVDRDNAMFFDKRFHLHLNLWPERDLDWLARSVAYLRTLVDRSRAP